MTVTEDQTARLRAHVFEALNTAAVASWQDESKDADAPEREWRRHDKHRYDARCALCAGEAGTLTDAVMAVLASQLEAEAARGAKAAGKASAELQAALDRHAGWQLEYDIALIVADRQRLLARIAELEDNTEEQP